MRIHPQRYEKTFSLCEISYIGNLLKDSLIKSATPRIRGVSR